MAYLQLGELATFRGDMSAALELTVRSLESNALNPRALNLKAAVLRHLGHPREVLEAVNLVASAYQAVFGSIPGGSPADRVTNPPLSP